MRMIYRFLHALTCFGKSRKEKYKHVQVMVEDFVLFEKNRLSSEFNWLIGNYSIFHLMKSSLPEL